MIGKGQIACESDRADDAGIAPIERFELCEDAADCGNWDGDIRIGRAAHVMAFDM
ncbi:MAG: hypothetical protein H9533_15230 [Rhodobacteraceae bacterium]|nr:hypothetical protein [Paracoccaceae bacterium]